MFRPVHHKLNRLFGVVSVAATLRLGLVLEEVWAGRPAAVRLGLAV